MNCDLDFLNSHYRKLVTFRESQQRLAEMRSTLISAHQLDGIPAHQLDTTRLERLAFSLEAQEREVDFLSAGLERENKRILKFTKNIHDNRTKVIITLRFFVGCTWSEVAEILGGRETTESCKMACYRYFSKR